MNVLNENRFLYKKKTILLFSAFAILIIWLQAGSIQKKQNASLGRQPRGSIELQQKLVLAKNSPSLGFRNLLADSIFLQFLQYFSDASMQEKTDKNLSPVFFDAIIALDPFYQDFYLFLSSSTTFYAGEPQKTVELMAKGLKQIDPSIMPESYYIWRYKGVDELLFLGDSRAAQKSFEMAAEWANQSNSPDSDLVEKVSRQTAEFLKSDPDSRYAQISAWSSVLSNALNDDIREGAIQRIQELGGSIKEDGSISIDSAKIDHSSREAESRG